LQRVQALSGKLQGLEAWGLTKFVVGTIGSGLLWPMVLYFVFYGWDSSAGIFTEADVWILLLPR
jgi:hypothetical protein